jgi:CDP-diacylglycerol--serine O-phosphatidyltransferase
MKKMIKKIKSSLAVVVSLLNASLGILAIYYTHLAANNTTISYNIAIILMLAAFCTDGLDGFCARRFHSSSDFGREIDSLCDLISFGVAPGFLIVSINPSIISLLLFILIVASGILRLAKFNVTKFDGYFRGTPITLNGLVIPLAFWLWPGSLPFVIALLTVTMNLPFKFKKVSAKKCKSIQNNLNT